MAYAIIETGGKQMRVEPGRFYDIERLAGERWRHRDRSAHGVRGHCNGKNPEAVPGEEGDRLQDAAEEEDPQEARSPPGTDSSFD
jgi:hypothetical protein